MRLAHAAFLVEDLDHMIAFYSETLGLAVSDVGNAAGRSSGPRVAFLSWAPSTLHHELALFEVNRDPKAARNVHHIAFEVDSLDDLRTVWKRVANDPRAASLDPNTDGPVTAFMGDQWSIRFTDPEGNGVEIYAPTPWDAVAAAAPYTASGFAFEPFDINASDDALAIWGAQHMDAMGQEHWPRGERPWPRT